jgi:hypothetical protein
MQRWSEEHRAFALEMFFKNNDSANVMQCVFWQHFDIWRNGKGSDMPNNTELGYIIQDYCIHCQQEASWSTSNCTNTGKCAPSGTYIWV